LQVQVLNIDSLKLQIGADSYEIHLPGAELAPTPSPITAFQVPSGAAVRLRTISGLLKTELTSLKSSSVLTVPLEAGEGYQLLCRACNSTLAEGISFGRVLEQPPEDVQFFCHSHDNLRPEARQDDLLFGPGVWITRGAPDVCKHCGQCLGFTVRDKTTLWKSAVYWKGQAHFT
jgi:hypothetical protein